MRKRIKGIPTKGAVTLVFVDMEEYEGLVENMPSQMDIIMRLVNSSLRKSKRTNMGFTFEQDMCSHCFVFHEAFDAAKFCLQASFQVARNVVSKFFTRSDVSQPAHIGPGPCPGSSSAQTGPGPGRSSLEAGFPMESTTVEEAKQYQFHGPGLRMGISSGKVEEGVQLKGSNMYKMAKGKDGGAGCGDSRRAGLLQASTEHSTPTLFLVSLVQARGGYLVRQQEGDLKYMVAFCKPQDAIAWCVLAQECLMYMNWPASALQFWKEQKDARGAFIFRGPRFKMGIYEGSPRSILPDHLGRADYFGDSINMAARYMDAGAHGGQLVCENHLALQAFAAWSTDDVEAPLNSTQQAPFMQAGHAKSYKQSVVLPSVSEDEPVPGKQDLTDEHSSSDVPGNKAVGTGIGIATPPGSVPATPSGAKVTTPLGSVPATPSGAKVTTPLGSVPATPSRAKPTTPLGSVPATPSGTKLETPGRLTGHLHNGASDLSFGSPQFQAPKGASNASKPPLAKDRPRPIVGASNASKPPLAKPPKDVPRPLSTASSPVTPQDSENPSVKSNRSSSKSDALCSSDSSSAEQLATWSLNQGLAPRSTLVVGTPTTTTTMRAERLGYFRFKGAADKVKLVSIYHDALAQRMYTQQAPQGKGNRLSRATGLVASVLVELPAIVDAFKDKLLETEVSRANTPFNQAQLESLEADHQAQLADVAHSQVTLLEQQQQRQQK
eukprot:gene30850-35890_t